MAFEQYLTSFMATQKLEVIQSAASLDFVCLEAHYYPRATPYFKRESLSESFTYPVLQEELRSLFQKYSSLPNNKTSRITVYYLFDTGAGTGLTVHKASQRAGYNAC
jgi:hypothetical protein